MMNPERAPLASVVICTRNRAHSLLRTLESLVLAAARTNDPWELIVVDNGSSDDTVAMIETFAGRLPVRAVSQPVPGLSNARNAAVAAARGEFILWTDDDVQVDEHWLMAWFRAFRTRPNDIVFGGRTEPRFEEPRCDWFIDGQEHLQSLLAVRQADWTEVTWAQMPWGLNYAVRAAEQRRYAYDPELGVAPGRRRGGEEVAVIGAILADGGTGSWVWDATVFHLIPAERQSKDYIMLFYEAYGRDYPMFGPVYGIGRISAIIRVLIALSKSYLFLAFSGSHHCHYVTKIVELAKLNGSLANYSHTRFAGHRDRRCSP